MKRAITIKNITKIFQEDANQKLVILQHINLEIFSGEFFVIVGPSGSGKSTLLRIMSGLEKSYEGDVLLGEEFSPSDMSFVFQEFALFPWLTVFENIELGLFSSPMTRLARNEIVKKELRQFGLEKFAHLYPRELSGGMRQRTGLARALAKNPKIIFMDEPFSELDSFTAEELRKDLIGIWRERKPTIILVTHLIKEAIELADRIAVFTPRPGKIEKIVVNFLDRPRNGRTPEFWRFEDELYQLIKP